jgi:hypothetical protein
MWSMSLGLRAIAHADAGKYIKAARRDAFD